jgi:hypothetical protein
MVAHRVLGFTRERVSRARKCLPCNEARSIIRKSGYSSTTSGLPCWVSARQPLRIWITSLGALAHDIQIHDRIVHVLKEFIIEKEAFHGRDSRLEVPCTWYGASRDRPIDVVWLDFTAPHRHLVYTTLSQKLSDIVGTDVEFVVSSANNAVAPATLLSCLQLPAPDALARLGDSGGHIQRGISRIFVLGLTLTSWSFAYLPHRTM